MLVKHEFMQVIANRPSFLYASVTRSELSVYRSTALPENDEWFQPISRLFDTHLCELMFREVVRDRSMMFGEAEHSIYLMKENL